MKTTRVNYKHNYVMLIDDVELDNFINEKLIKSYDYAQHVYVNTSATSAIEFLNNLIIMGEEFNHAFPEIIFIDINMPVTSGFEFISTFKKDLEKKFRKTKLVILTSSVAQIDREKAITLSEELIFLNKPLSKQMLDPL